MAIVGINDFLATMDNATPKGYDLERPRRSQPTGYAFAALFYFVFCYAMSLYSASMERRLRLSASALNGGSRVWRSKWG